MGLSRKRRREQQALRRERERYKMEEPIVDTDNHADKDPAMREFLTELGGALDLLVKEAMPHRNIGFCLLLFDFGDEGHTNYISNAGKEDMVKLEGAFRRMKQQVQ